MLIAQWDFVYAVNCKVFKFKQDSIKRNATASYKTLPSTSLIQCAETCAGESECSSVSFNEATETCHMMSDTVGPQAESLRDEGMESYTLITRCPPDYTFIDGTCVKLSSEASNYTLASDACAKEGAVLAQMTPGRMFHEIVRHMFNNGQSPTGFFRVGSTDIEEEGIWRWNDGASISQWCMGDPSDLNGEENCLSLYVSTGLACFVDYTCMADIQYLCQKPALRDNTCYLCM
ncbi:C-type lectin domain family 4 member M-like [Haliotis rufescens]|uniref:C-type lectin domain family 4 member M-like n=1 Tax=Haliotis rufescens TaxID=6454 RepID=UPI00201F5400|nr:C-type lectin domain family 4 member M-like [Haliotis rufescens]